MFFPPSMYMKEIVKNIIQANRERYEDNTHMHTSTDTRTSKRTQRDRAKTTEQDPFRNKRAMSTCGGPRFKL